MTAEKKQVKRTSSVETIKTTLIALMNEKPKSQISVSQIAETAGLSRRTFYRYFLSVDEVLDAVAFQMRKEFTAYLEVQQPTTMRMLLYTCFTFWEPRKEILSGLAYNHLLYPLIDEFMQIARRNRQITRGKQVSEEVLEWAVPMMCGTFFGVLMQWIAEDFAHTPDEMTVLSMSVFSALLSGNVG